jgi:hypothetical protein
MTCHSEQSRLLATFWARFGGRRALSPLPREKTLALLRFVASVVLVDHSRRPVAERRAEFDAPGAFRPAGHGCFVCHYPRDLGRHHVLPLFRGAENSDDNTILLCSDCHAAVEPCRTNPAMSPRTIRLTKEVYEHGTQRGNKRRARIRVKAKRERMEDGD